MLTLRAIYDDMEKLAAGLKALKDSGMWEYEAYGPTSLDNVQDLMKGKGSKVRMLTYVGGIAGLVFFWYMCMASSLVFKLVTGGKPAISNVPFIVVGYQGAIFVASVAAFLGVLVFARLGRKKTPAEYDSRFSGTDFGIVVHIRPEDRNRAADILRASGAVEINELA